MQPAFRGSLDFLRFVRVFLIIMFSTSLGLLPNHSLLNVSHDGGKKIETVFSNIYFIGVVAGRMYKEVEFHDFLISSHQ